jgi:hypothetical protein
VDPSSRPALADRVRLHSLGLSVVALAQGIPFFHAGDELLRSTSEDRNSYDSGDRFDRVDWTGQVNGWGAGLPPARNNQGDWALLAPLLAEPSLAPGPAEMAAARAQFEDFPRIRRSTPLFRLRPAAGVLMRLGGDGRPLRLHPVQQGSADPVVRTARFDRRTGTFTLPARPTAVFVAPPAVERGAAWRW